VWGFKCAVSLVVNQEFPKLIQGTEVDVLVEVPDGEDFCSSGEHSVCWLPAQLLTVVCLFAKRLFTQEELCQRTKECWFCLFCSIVGVLQFAPCLLNVEVVRPPKRLRWFQLISSLSFAFPLCNM
jgi:hypothetical protein